MTSTAALVAPSSLDDPAPFLVRLAVVERQLITQDLDITSLARLASTCRQLRGEALHKEAGKLIPRPGPHSGVDHRCWLDHDHSAHASPLFRMHAPVCLSFDVSSRAALIVKASGFARITQLQIGAMQEWAEEEVLQLLAQPWMQTVSCVDIQSFVWLRSSVQPALFSLPHLTFIRLSFAGCDRSCALLVSAVKLASRLAEAHVMLGPADPKPIRALKAAPSLARLRLQTISHGIPLGPLLGCIPTTLIELTLCNFSLDPLFMTRSELKTMLTRLPLLQRMAAEYMEVLPLLQGVINVGASALPNLRCVTFEDCEAGDLSAVVPRFQSAFPAATLHLSPDVESDTEAEGHENCEEHEADDDVAGEESLSEEEAS